MLVHAVHSTGPGLVAKRSYAAARVGQALDLLGRLKEAKAAVDHAKKVEKGEASVFKAKERKVNAVLNNSFGFGGTNASLVMRAV